MSLDYLLWLRMCLEEGLGPQGGWEGENILSDKRRPQGLYRRWKWGEGTCVSVFDMPGNVQQPSGTGGSVATQVLPHSPHTVTPESFLQHEQ